MDVSVSVRFEARVANGITCTAFLVRSFRRRYLVLRVIQALYLL